MGSVWAKPYAADAAADPAWAWLGHRGCRAAPSGSRGWNLKEPRLLKRAASVWLRTTLYPKAGQTYPDYPRSNTSSGGDDGDGHHHCHHPRWPSSAPTRITVLLAMVASIPHTGVSFRDLVEGEPEPPSARVPVGFSAPPRQTDRGAPRSLPRSPHSCGRKSRSYMCHTKVPCRSYS